MESEESIFHGICTCSSSAVLLAVAPRSLSQLMGLWFYSESARIRKPFLWPNNNCNLPEGVCLRLLDTLLCENSQWVLLVLYAISNSTSCCNFRSVPLDNTFMRVASFETWWYWSPWIRIQGPEDACFIRVAVLHTLVVCAGSVQGYDL